MSDMANNAGVAEVTGKIMVVSIIFLFLVVIFVLFLHLYAKWFWWQHDHVAEQQNQHNINNPQLQLAQRRRRRRLMFTHGQVLEKGLDVEVMRSLEVVEWRKEGDGECECECAVCLCEVAEGEKVRMLPKCNHVFHVECIDMWFQSHSTCPLCRNTVEMSALVEDGVSSKSVVVSGVGSRSYPTNVLFWGDDTEVYSGGSSNTNVVVIDVPSSELVSTSSEEHEHKSLAMPTRERMLKRDQKVNATSSRLSSLDLEQGIIHS